MQGKKIKTVIKLNLPAGEATPAPPVGPALGQHGLNIMNFTKAYNEQTMDKKGQIIPVEITVYEDRTFTFVTKLPPVAELIKKKLNLKKGSSLTSRESVGGLTQKEAEEIAIAKLPDLNTTDPKQGAKIVMGTARSMGVELKE